MSILNYATLSRNQLLAAEMHLQHLFCRTRLGSPTGRGIPAPPGAYVLRLSTTFSGMRMLFSAPVWLCLCYNLVPVRWRRSSARLGRASVWTGLSRCPVAAHTAVRLSGRGSQSVSGPWRAVALLV
jgi:hypothetical protein